MRLSLTVSLLAMAALLCGCADTRYYWQSAAGHLEVMRAARPVQEWLADESTPAPLRERLALAERIRAFAVSDLALPDNPSYRRYADLKRRAVVWNVVAAPELSLKLRTWCFAVVGCIGYRGYFDEAQARDMAAQLQREEALEVSVYGVPAYSTLGWMNWAGGDPLLNTFIYYPEGELARLVFHELAHQVAYARDDTAFNESFATAVERLGGARWLASHSSPRAREEYAAFDARRNQFRTLNRATRQALSTLYSEEKQPAAPVNQDKRAIKSRVMQDFRAQYAQLRAAWLAAPGGASLSVAGYDAWVASANNAAFAAQAAYDDLVPAFEALFEREAGGRPQREGWQRFYDAVRRLADLPAGERRAALELLKPKTEASGG